MAFERVFLHRAVEHFDWRGKGAEEMFRYNKVIKEIEFPLTGNRYTNRRAFRKLLSVLLRMG